MFKKLDNEKASVVESKISEHWEELDILNKSLENKKENFVFYDGPATANGFPGLHHMVAKFLKDSFCKYKTMQGYKVLRKVGWDTHGLPVEVEVEKTLGFNGKGDIEKYGVREFNEKCREIVWKNEKAFSDLTTKMGQFIDLKHPYVTYDNNYIETEWYILKKFFDEGLFYEGVKIVPFCTRCGTGLASHEVAQGYKEIDAQTVIVPFKKKDADEYFLVWTTTPWTLISNVALCVNPNEVYVKVESKGYKFILAKALLEQVLGSDYEILEEYKGTDLEYVEYEQLIPSLSVNKKAFFVTNDNYVTMDSGTGIVHIAPAFGEDDSKVGKKYNLPYLNPVGEDGKYTDGIWKGMNVFEADLAVIKYLKENDKLFKKQKMSHNYPHCWRCGTPLLYYSKPSFYLEVTKLKEKIIEANKHVNWYPSYVGEKRFGNWLENMNDWAISRSRYWGTPLPLWRCECGCDVMIGSREELASKAIEKIDETIELHRPYVDDVHIKCPKCGKTMNRVRDVIDCWFDSGSMPFAQYHYPFENMKLWESQFPADFISEGIDQTRGWFYSLLVISVFLKGVSPYKNVLVNDLLLDKDGKKMSKSKGNIVEPFTTIEKYGADTVRFYLPYVSPVWTPLKFDEEGLKEVHSKFFNPLLNTYTFFETYANIDKIDPRTYDVKYDELEEIDKWLLSKYNKLLKYVTESFDEYDLNKVVRALVTFVSDDLSNWYIRRNRNRFWGSEIDNSKKAVYKTTYDVLVGLSKMIAPIVPFTSENLYTKLTDEESVHLADFPKYNEGLIDLKIEEKMDTVRDLISMGRKVREDVKIKVRQPISEVILDSKIKNIIGDLSELIKEELNVKTIKFESNLDSYINYSIKPNFKVCGKVFGSNIKALSEYLNNVDKEIITKLDKGEKIQIELNNQEYELDKEMLDIRVNSKEGYDTSVNNDLFIILNTTLTDELINEGIARELVSKVQNLRKEKDFNITDRIYIYCYSEEDLMDKIKDYIDFIKKETLCDVILQEKKVDEVTNLNGINAYLDVVKV
ncbi:MAG: isoleucine--tRNA ligase [Bacilli bacterium]|nr:isoleucine--tRNA ligase [Bacilli bacterium]